MKHAEDFLNNLWNAISSGDQKRKADAVRNMAATNIDIQPEIICNDAVAQVLSVPVADNTDRAVYARKPSGQWAELQ